VREHREAARPLVASFGGRIVRIIGDGLLLEFPSIVAAVECAIAIQKLMTERNAETPEPKRILYRIGINLGDVLMEGDDIVGDGVNIAARLEGICEPGGIFVSGSAFDHVRGRIDVHFVDLGEKDLKNIVRPVRVYALRPASAAAPKASQPDMQRPPRLSIVVLPFANMSGEPEQEYFVDGVTESLTTDLSRTNGFFVIGRNTAFTYKVTLRRGPRLRGRPYRSDRPPIPWKQIAEPRLRDVGDAREDVGEPGLDFFITAPFNADPELWEEYIEDTRFRGAYLRIAETWEPRHADLVRERLIVNAADKGDHTTSDEFIRRLEKRRRGRGHSTRRDGKGESAATLSNLPCVGQI
jgi:Adenylate and Guanylate cyclase catalytic domain